MCDSVEHGGNRQLHLWPRDCFKSTMITVGNSLYALAKNPNVRIFIGNAVASNANSFLREIKGHLERNKKLRDIIGDYTEKAPKWNDDMIIVGSRTKNMKEPSIQTAGVGASLVSQHYDLMILDDLVNRENVNTPELIQKTIDWYRLALSLLEPHGTLIIIGTRYHYKDLYGHLLKEASDTFKIQVHSVYQDDGSIIFPERFTPEYLAQLRKDQGSYIFSCQYLNNPVDDENAKFKASDFRYYEEKYLEGKELYTVYMIDRAYSLAKTADYTSHVIVSVDLDNNWYVRLAFRTKELEGKLIERIFDNKNYFKVDKVGIEQRAFNDTIKPVLEEEMRSRNDFFKVEELKGLQSKTARIEGLVPRFEAHSVFFLPGMNDMEDELTHFPAAEHDDLADALAYGNQLARKPSASDVKKKTPIYSKSGRVVGYR
jgi:predicted phage terminase large subunit-like protein